ncbi:MAG TPA: FTR1 family protein [Stellaceae bacterium]|nr:FTR1 family protein [Stellaceae bacterium]
MLAVAVIVFREVLEAALVVSIVLAASHGIPGRGRWVAGGIVAGVLGAMVVAAFTGEISAALAGIGQEVFDASVLFGAVVMLGWHNVWMNRHGREMAEEAKSVSAAIRAGARPLYALGIVTGLAVLREGSEIVLFVYGIVAAQGTGIAGILSGGALGLAGGAGLGAALYFGLLRVPLRYLFTVTGVVVLFLAAGMASQGAAFLLQADLVPALGNELWNTSAILPDRSLAGQLLHVLIGYVARPAGIQLVFYVATLGTIGGLMLGLGRRRVAHPAVV